MSGPRFKLWWNFRSGHSCILVFRLGDLHRLTDVVLWWWSLGWCDYEEAEAALDLVENVIAFNAKIYPEFVKT